MMTVHITLPTCYFMTDLFLSMTVYIIVPLRHVIHDN